MHNICTSFTTSKYSIRILRLFILKLKKNNIVKMDIRLVDNTKKNTYECTYSIQLKTYSVTL